MAFEPFKQAPREPDDGQVGVLRTTDDQGRDRLLITCGEHHIECSEYNASRIFGMLSFILEIPLSKSVGKAIKLGGNTERDIG